MLLSEEQIERVFRALLLVPGDAHLTTAEFATVVGVSERKALQAMRDGGIVKLWRFEESEKLGGGGGTRPSRVSLYAQHLRDVLRLHMLAADVGVDGAAPGSTLSVVIRCANTIEYATSELAARPLAVGYKNDIVIAEARCASAVRRDVIDRIGTVT